MGGNDSDGGAASVVVVRVRLVLVLVDAQGTTVCTNVPKGTVYPVARVCLVA